MSHSNIAARLLQQQATILNLNARVMLLADALREREVTIVRLEAEKTELADALARLTTSPLAAASAAWGGAGLVED